MIKESLLEIFGAVWPMLLICSVIIISIRIIYVYRNRADFILYKELLMFFFIIYIMCLYYAVTFQDIEVSWSTWNLIPLKEMFRYSFGSRLFIKNVLGNIILFMPFGFFISYLLRLDKKGIVIFLTLITSTTIEITQLLIGRVFDIDDIILNVVGGLLGLLGFYLFKIIYTLKEQLPTVMKKNYVYNILMIFGILLISMVIIKVVTL